MDDSNETPSVTNNLTQTVKFSQYGCSCIPPAFEGKFALKLGTSYATINPATVERIINVMNEKYLLQELDSGRFCLYLKTGKVITTQVVLKIAAVPIQDMSSLYPGEIFAICGSQGFKPSAPLLHCFQYVGNGSKSQKIFVQKTGTDGLVSFCDFENVLLFGSNVNAQLVKVTSFIIDDTSQF